MGQGWTLTLFHGITQPRHRPYLSEKNGRFNRSCIRPSLFIHITQVVYPYISIQKIFFCAEKTGVPRTLIKRTK